MAISSGRLTSATRLRLLIALSALALLAALVASVAGESKRATYQFAAGASSSESSSEDVRQIADGLATPLLLAAHRPDRLDLEWSCAESPERPGAWFSTSRGSEVPDRLVLLAGSGWTLELDGNDIATIEPGKGERCLFTAVAPDSWRFEVDGRIVEQGTASLPVVSALSTVVRPNGEDWIDVRIVTQPYAYRSSLLRVVSRAVTLLALVAVTGLLIWPQRRRIRRPGRLAAWSTAYVGGLLGVLLFVEPLFEDDGWVMATIENYSSTGQFGNYYNSWNSTYASATAFMHMLQWVLGWSSSLVALRGLALVVSVVSWWLMLRIFHRLSHGDLLRFRRHVLYALPAYSLCAISWLITLRPEPYIAMASAVVLLCAIAVVQDEDMRYLALAGVACGFAIASHPGGIVAVAPMLVIAPELLTRVRTRVIRLRDLAWSLMFPAAASLWMLFADLDVGGWRLQARLNENPGISNFTWRDDLLHYLSLFDAGNAPRRLSWLVVVVAVIAYLTRRDRDIPLESALPVRSFVVASILIAALPSKWLWHFGALTAIGVVVVAHELDRLYRSRHSRTATQDLTLIAAMVISLSIAWAGGMVWLSQTALTAFGYSPEAADLGIFPLSLTAFRNWFAAAAVFALGHWILRRRRDGRERFIVGAGIAPPFIAMSSLASFAIALGVLVGGPIARSPQWSLPAQQLEDLVGSTCGLADELVPVGEAEPADELGSAAAEEELASFGPLWSEATDGAPVPYLFASVIGTPSARTSSELHHVVGSWYDLTDLADGATIALYTNSESAFSFSLQVGSERYGEIVPIEVLSLDTPSIGSWTEVSLAGARVSGANRIRVVIKAVAADAGMWAGASAPTVPLATSVTDLIGSEPTLVSPFVRFYFPCLELPAIDKGVAELPLYRVDSGIFSVFDGLTTVTQFGSDLQEAHQITLRWRDDLSLAQAVVLLRMEPLDGVDLPSLDEE